MHVHRAMLFALAVFFLASCGKTTPTPTPAPTPSTPERDTSTPVKRAASEPEIVKLDASGFKDARIDKGPFRTDAHRKYLSDPIKFTALPDQGLAKGATAVVGSKVCMFYPNAALASAEDLAKLPAGIPAIPS